MWNINMCTLLAHWGRDGLRAQTAFHKMLQVFVFLAFLIEAYPNLGYYWPLTVSKIQYLGYIDTTPSYTFKHMCTEHKPCQQTLILSLSNCWKQGMFFALTEIFLWSCLQRWLLINHSKSHQQKFSKKTVENGQVHSTLLKTKHLTKLSLTLGSVTNRYRNNDFETVKKRNGAIPV